MDYAKINQTQVKVIKTSFSVYTHSVEARRLILNVCSSDGVAQVDSRAVGLEKEDI